MSEAPSSRSLLVKSTSASLRSAEESISGDVSSLGALSFPSFNSVLDGSISF